MSRRRILLALGAVPLLGVGGFFLFLCLTTPVPVRGVTGENFHRLWVSMSAKELEALLGEPCKVQDIAPGKTVRTWQGDAVNIMAFIDAEDGLTLGVAWPRHPGPGDSFGYIRPPECFLDRVRRWLPW